jgi:hypothetical protein
MAWSRRSKAARSLEVGEVDVGMIWARPVRKRRAQATARPPLRLCLVGLRRSLVRSASKKVRPWKLTPWRIENFASVVGKEHLIAGVDCGFSQYVGQIRCHPSVQWARLEALAKGAALASKALWGR